MQHHGVPTRLLDWSTNALAALYFAVEHARPPELSDRPVEDEGLQEFSSDDVAVYCMNPATINSVLHAVNGPIDIAEAGERWAKYADPCASEIAAYEPVCIVAPHVSPRIRAQSGTFTLHGSNVDPLDYYDNLRGLLHKVLISKRSAERIRGQLALLGMTTSYIYPDLDGLAREITAQERERFLAQRRRHLASLTASNN
jgi:hypothetical protein